MTELRDKRDDDRRPLPSLVALAKTRVRVEIKYPRAIRYSGRPESSIGLNNRSGTTLRPAAPDKGPRNLKLRASREEKCKAAESRMLILSFRSEKGTVDNRSARVIGVRQDKTRRV